MSPPPEQLIRDYLNRLSVAARGRLDNADRRELVSRTRDFIDRNTGLLRTTTAVQVGRLLHGLGDPAVLVEHEVKRLSAMRGEQYEPRRQRLGLVPSSLLRRAQGAASWHWPVQEGSRADLRATLMAPVGGADEPSDGDARIPEFGSGRVEVITRPITARWRPGSPQPERSLPMPRVRRGAGRDGSGAAGGGVARAAVAGQPDSAQVTARPVPAQAPEPAGKPAPERPRWPSVVARSVPAGGVTTEQARPAAEATGLGDAAPVAQPLGSDAASAAQATPANGQAAPARTVSRRRQLSRRGRVLAGQGLGWLRERPLEGIAVVLLGIGGAIYPPIWVLGAIIALFSRLWDGRDKWLGLGLPVVLTIIGSIAGVAAGGHSSASHDFHAGWLFADVLSRLLAFVGAAYLTWRADHGKRPPAVPPWNRPHRIS